MLARYTLDRMRWTERTTVRRHRRNAPASPAGDGFSAKDEMAKVRTL
jgi:hypothetical protein